MTSVSLGRAWGDTFATNLRRPQTRSGAEARLGSARERLRQLGERVQGVWHCFQFQPAVDAWDDGLDQVWAGRGDRALELSDEVLAGVDAHRGHSEAARDPDEVEIRAAEVELGLRAGAAAFGA